MVLETSRKGSASSTITAKGGRILEREMEGAEYLFAFLFDLANGKSLPLVVRMALRERSEV